MKALQRPGLLAVILLFTVLLAACGSTGTPTTTMNNGNSKTMNNGTTKTMNNGTTYSTGTNYGNGTNTTPTTTTKNGTTMNTGSMNNNMDNGTAMNMNVPVALNMTGNMNAFVHTAKAAINGRQVNVLVTNTGMALYYYKPDTMNQATCTGACATSWPPLLAPKGMMTISSSIALPKMFSVHQTPNGAQVFYDGHALYTYAADSQAGTATGRGQDMQWYMVGFML